MAEQDKFIINVAKILAPVVGSRDLMPILSEAVNKADVKSVDLDFSEVEFVSRSAAHALLLMKEDLQRKWLNKKFITFVNTSDNVQEMFRVVAANRAVPKAHKQNIEIEKTNIDSLAKCSC
ncbi:MAG: hypothetical protein AAB963_00655 [Patescibacteria group bacterium]